MTTAVNCQAGLFHSRDRYYKEHSSNKHLQRMGQTWAILARRTQWVRAGALGALSRLIPSTLAPSYSTVKAKTLRWPWRSQVGRGASTSLSLTDEAPHVVLSNQPQPKCSDKSALFPPIAPNPAPAAVASINSKILQLLSLKLLIFFFG